MAIEHVTIGSSDCHEPKHISLASTSDAGKIITPSSATAGASDFRYLEGEEISSTNEDRGKVLTAQGDGTSSWASADTIYAYLESTNDFGFDAGDAVNISLKYSSDSSGDPWASTSNSVIVPEDGLYRVSFSFFAGYNTYTSPTSITVKDFLVIPGTSAPGVFDANTAYIGGTVGQDTVSGQVLIPVNVGNSIKLFCSFSGGIQAVAKRRSMFIEKVADL